ncbi:50S ribosomal protein L23 [Candidatus Zixiibacteriota bacterium]
MKSAQDIIIRPLITERAANMMEKENKVVFEVAVHANKNDIKRAVEELFEVTVMAVRTMNVKGKIKTMGKHSGRRSSWKKAIITLGEGDSLDFFEGA